MPALPSKMRQVIFDGAGGPEVVKLAQADVPTPGAGKVLVEVAAFGINRPDCAQRAGAYPPPPGETQVPGLEIAGRIVAVGPDVTGLKVGDEIEAMIVNVDRKTRGINLSIKAKDSAEQHEAMQKLASESSAASGTTNLGALLKAKLNQQG